MLYADILGVKPDDIEVNMEAGVLTTKGEKKSEAKSKNGGLETVIPKREAVQTKRINVAPKE